MGFQRTILLAALIAALNPAYGQDAPQAEELLRTWFSNQQNAVARGDTLFYDEVEEWKIDAPFGRPTMGMHSRVRTLPNTSTRWTRTIDVQVNGRKLPPARYNEVKNRWHTNTRSQIREVMHETEIRPALLSRMRPATRTVTEELNGDSVWRLELIRRERRQSVERITLWFSTDTRQLLQSRVILNPGVDKPNFVITTEYVNEDSYDRPEQRTVEGNVTLKRRSRLYTVLISYSGTYSNFSIRKYNDS